MDRKSLVDLKPHRRMHSESHDKRIILQHEDRFVIDERAFNNFKQTEPPRQLGEVAHKEISRFDPIRHFLVTKTKPGYVTRGASKRRVGFRREQINEVRHLSPITMS